MAENRYKSYTATLYNSQNTVIDKCLLRNDHINGLRNGIFCSFLGPIRKGRLQMAASALFSKCQRQAAGYLIRLVASNVRCIGCLLNVGIRKSSNVSPQLGMCPVMINVTNREQKVTHIQFFIFKYLVKHKPNLKMKSFYLLVLNICTAIYVLPKWNYSINTILN